jgi:hypothetical protein
MNDKALNTKMAAINETFKDIDDWGKKNPERNSTIAGAGAVVGGIVALNVLPSLFVTGSIIYTLYSMGTKTADATLNRWTEGDNS